jgi:hypothetical protein
MNKKKKETKISSDKLNNLLKASYKNNDEAGKIADKNGYKIDRELSTNQHKVFVDGRGNPNVVYRGTQTLKDVMTDGALAFGMIKNTTRFDQSKKLMDNVKSKYKDKYITTAGHSLGGSLAEAVGGDKVITVNKGAGIDNLLKKRKSNQTDIRAGGDLVSALSTAQSGGKMITVKNTNYVNPLVSHDSNVIRNLNKKI